MKYTIALGTKSKPKHSFLVEVLEELGIKADINCYDADSQVSNQPMTEADTKAGSINRARNALSMSDDADFGLGVEVGYHETPNHGYEMMCSAAIVDHDENLFQAYSSRLLLPEFHQSKLSSGEYLGDYVREYEAGSDALFSKFTREMIIHRGPFIKESVRNVLIGYLSRK